MHFQLLDIFSVGIIGMAALAFIVRTYFKMRKNKCATLCSGCNTGSSCGSRAFNSKKILKIIKLS